MIQLLAILCDKLSVTRLKHALSGFNMYVSNTTQGQGNKDGGFKAGQLYSFCIVSDSMRNNHPAAIWAYLTPVLNYIQRELPSVTEINFWSDGPTIPCLNKAQFFFL
jgi:hypothetical protein